MITLYPDVKVKLVGEDGNAFAIIGRVTGAMRRAKVPFEAVEAFRAEATSGDYNKLLATCLKYVACDEEEYEEEDDEEEDLVFEDDEGESA